MNDPINILLNPTKESINALSVSAEITRLLMTIEIQQKATSAKLETAEIARVFLSGKPTKKVSVLMDTDEAISKSREFGMDLTHYDETRKSLSVLQKKLREKLADQLEKTQPENVLDFLRGLPTPTI
jgi:hypothetical protein